MSYMLNQEWEPNQADAEPTAHALTQAAIAKGFTRDVTLDNAEYTLTLLVRPDCDLDERFKAWDLDEGEWIRVNGWLFVEAI